ncbi:MAG: MFS transporter [Akkermansiaceae bacterium]|nr:MFS transporter [Akkermansiaceae bacterium]
MSSIRSSAAWTIAASALAAGMAFIDTTALTVALPALREALAADETQLLWIHNAYAVTLAAFLLLCGSLGDRFGIRRVFMTGITCFGLSSIACGLAPTADSLIALRALQGLSAALMIPGSLAMIARSTPAASLGKAVGLWSAFTLIATAIGPILGGALVQAGWWRGVFFINVPLALVALWITFVRSAADPKNEHSRTIDWIASLLLVLGLASLSYALIERSWVVALGTLAFGLFYLREKAATKPMLPPEALRSRKLQTAILLSLLIHSSWAGFTYLLPTHLIEARDFSPAAAGLVQIPTLIMVVVFSPIAGKWLDRLGPRPVLATGAAICALGFASLLWSGWASQALLIVIPLSFMGIGLGFCAAPLSATIIGSVSAEHHGLAAGINSTSARIASGLGVALLGSLAFEQGQVNFATLALGAAILCALALPTTLRFASQRQTDRSPEP